MSTNPEGLSQNVKESGRNLRSDVKNGKRIVLQQFESGLHLGYTSTHFRVQRAADFGKYLHSRGLQPTLVFGALPVLESSPGGTPEVAFDRLEVSA
jgi:hypothetical protein